MKKKSIIIVGIILCLLVTGSIIWNVTLKEKDILSTLHYPKRVEKEKKTEIEDTILIEYSYSNYAWAYTYYGELITEDGNRYLFNCDKKNSNPTDCIVKKESSIKKEDLEKLLELRTTVKEELKKEMMANDFGQVSILLYSKNKTILLSSYGDVSVINKNNSSKEVLKILKKYNIYTK